MIETLYSKVRLNLPKIKVLIHGKGHLIVDLAAKQAKQRHCCNSYMKNPSDGAFTVYQGRRLRLIVT